MLCDLCHKNEAFIFIEQSGKGLKRKINLCAECAASRGINAPFPQSSQANLLSVFQELDEKKELSDPDRNRLCPGCGTSLAKIKLSGIAGCPECYDVFKDEIRESLKEHGIEGPYTGSLPLRVKGFRNSLTDRLDLQAKLEEAVKAEDYEKAAVYRDFLRALEKSSVQEGEDEKR